MTDRLDQPRELAPVRLRIHYDPEAFGQLSERIARFLGTARFIVYMTVFIAIWLVWNTVFPARFDPYPFIFLTLMLSLQASYSAPLILLAQNRQADRDRVQYEQDRIAAARTQAEIDYLTRKIADLRLAIREMATRDYIRAEFQRLREELNERGSGS